MTAVIADRWPLFRSGLARAIAHHPDLRLVGHANDGRGALAMIREKRPTVAVLGDEPAGLDGLAVLNAVKREGLATRVMLLWADRPEDDVVRTRHAVAGAAAVLTRDVDEGAILDAVLAVGRGETVIDPVFDGLDGVHADRFVRDDGGITLTRREQEVLSHMAAGRSGPQIARALFISPSTVKTHIHNVYGKLGVSHRGAAVAEAMRRGLVE
jgi:two-component system nitrate/nitrite response regulator NarL